MSDVISIKVPKELKEKMKRYKRRINWSKVIREFLMESIRLLEAKERLEEASTLINETKGVPLGYSFKVLSDRDGGD